MPATPLIQGPAAGAGPLQPDVVVIGAGLAGSLLALALAERGVAVSLVAPEAPDVSGAPAASTAAGEQLAATALSYGAMAGRAAADQWQRLQRRHGPLGWCPSGLVAHLETQPLDRLPPEALALAAAWLPLSRVDGQVLATALPAALARAGVVRRQGWVTALEPQARGGWNLQLRWDGGGPVGSMASRLTAHQVVLAAGAGCRRLWPGLAPGLRSSWAGVLLATGGGDSPWLEQVRRGRVVMPRRWRLPELEQAAGGQPAEGLPGGGGGERWVVDPGLTARGAEVLLGQISLLRPGIDPGEPPDPAWMETRLRQGLARLDPLLADLPARYRQVPVPFCPDGVPLVGPVDGAAGLWVFTGFSGAFTQVPPAAVDLAGAIAQWLNPVTL